MNSRRFLIGGAEINRTRLFLYANQVDPVESKLFHIKVALPRR